MLLNPFLVVVYLIDVMQKMESRTFRKVLLRAGIISSLVFYFWLFRRICG